ncbi:RND efflux system, outer membrane lipoprotein, NodT family [Flexistipes sinusarabici DSM 4947]|uniref:RND efflux system, outer membrane lipoprotein, NodT family n=1 Tax=Flexistipes sinusarabici (strain ATCC 49648 / DSM 4947 / MAS 10) TaxID=717231 RepID=F8E6W7_FLESM|nr:TolC family protein [Flexistipes sinusarabici]AEI13753.1 RND efflux system, outer membrane lipoprotein, NodT family [Flexistipes sinusarabici DSM 4947]
MKCKYLLLTVLILPVVFSCTVFKPEISQIETVLDNSKGSAAASFIDNETLWWNIFESPEISKLMDKAFGNNFNIKAAYYRIKQAQASYRKSYSGYYPSADLSLERSYNKQKQKNLDAVTTDKWSLGLNVSYEADIWGKTSAEAESAALQVDISRYNLKGSALILSTDIAKAWVDIIANNIKLNTLREQLKLNQDIYSILEERYYSSMADLIDLYQQESVIANIRSQIDDTISEIKQLKQSLNVLTGTHPGAKISVVTEQIPEINPLPKGGLPASVLKNRPDLKASWLKVKSAAWNVSSAKAARLPSLRLTGSYNYSAEKLADIFDNWALNLAGSLIAPIIDGGSRKAEVARSKAALQEAVMNYKQDTLNAVKEAEAAMLNEKKYVKRIKNTEKRLSIAEKILKEAERRYYSGMSDYSAVLNQRLNILELKSTLTDLKSSRIKSRIDLYKAAGGRIPELNEILKEVKNGRTAEK